MKRDTFAPKNLTSDIRILDPVCLPSETSKDARSELSDNHCDKLGTDKCVIVQIEDENRFRSIIDAVGGVIFVLDTDFNILEWNRTTEILSGWKREEVIGKNYLDSFVPESHKQYVKENILRALKYVVSKNIEFPFQTKNGEEMSISFNITNFLERDTKKIRIIANGLDVTERKKTEIKLKKAKSELENLVTAISSSTGLEETLEICLDTALRVSELDIGGIYTFEENTGSLVLVKHKGLSEEFVKVIKRFEVNSPHYKLALKGEPIYKNYQDIPPDRNEMKKENLKAIGIIPVKFKNKVIACLNVASHKMEFVPETARKALESIASEIGMAIARTTAIDALVESEKKYRAIIEATDTGYAIFDGEGRITDANMEYVRFTGIDSIESIKGKSISEWIDQTDWKRFKIVLQDVALGQEIKHYELKHFGANGKSTTVCINAKAVMTEDGVRIISLCRDINFRKEIEKVLVNNETRLRILSQRLISNDEEVRGRLSRELHDELGQQLSALLLEINLMKQQPDITNEHLDNLQVMIKNTTTELRRIYNGLNPVVLEKMDIKPALISLLDEYKSQGTLKMKCAIEDVSRCELHPEVSLCIYRVLQESLTNILRHSKAQNIFVKFYQKNRDFILIVRDDGIGFELGKEISKTGIGLTGLRERVLSCGGDFRIESIPGRGTRIVATIPAI